jgi:intein-encoded DNA endonuclease-like protein
MDKQSKINQNFFKIWLPEMAYILGFIVADGCIIKRKDRKDSYILNITSKDIEILEKIKTAIQSEYQIGKKYNSLGLPYGQIQICNNTICKDLIRLGINPQKTYNIKPLNIPQKHFPDFVRGFFDGDGTVYIYNVNKTPQIKSGFVCASLDFLDDFNKKLCKSLSIKSKNIYKTVALNNRVPQYSIRFCVNDSKKLEEFMYQNNPPLYLNRKKQIFNKWKTISRRHYIKKQ